MAHKYYPVCDACVRSEGQACNDPLCVYCRADKVPPEMPWREYGVDLTEVKRRVKNEVLRATLDLLRGLPSPAHPNFSCEFTRALEAIEGHIDE